MSFDPANPPEPIGANLYANLQTLVEALQGNADPERIVSFIPAAEADIQAIKGHLHI